jgi:hypothetical protein
VAVTANAPEIPPLLPLVLLEVPPGLAQAIEQEGIAHVTVTRPSPLSLRAGRFVLYDSRKVDAARAREYLVRSQILIDIDPLRKSMPGIADALRALSDTHAALRTWRFEGQELCERVARYPKSLIRRAVLDRLRQRVTSAGGVWARLAPLPTPYRSVFCLRLDFDERGHSSDAMAALSACRGLEDCTTVFVSTDAYGEDKAVLEALRPFDVQSHGHFHTVYRDAEANRRNLRRSRAILERAGYATSGFAGPHGRWNAGLGQVLREEGIAYSSEFQLGYDDWPFLESTTGSRVVQIPVHPVCEGLFLESGSRDPERILRYFEQRLAVSVSSGEPAIYYGHPERRLGRMTRVIEGLAAQAGACERLWRTKLTEYASWWRWRASRAWSVRQLGADRFEVLFENWDRRYPLAVELVRGSHVANLAVTGPRMALPLRSLVFARGPLRVDAPEPMPGPHSWGVRRELRRWLDWETVTPLSELPARLWRDRIKKTLRRFRGTSDGKGRVA